ncbi:hypothetical protein LIER_13820 [Lithospermum erythrorhizon]|uniref:MADS-box domain-containing protein n=1 Tax=Lithospermum erythrorhizon TaxID=34254 RepID=A0AAV3PYC8_LITER
MVRRKLEIKKIEDESKRHVTFTKRRQGLFKKAKELCKKSGDEVAIVSFSLAGNMYAFRHPSVDSIVKRYEATEDNGAHADVANESTESVVEEEELDQLEKETEEMVNKVRDIAKDMVEKM